MSPIPRDRNLDSTLELLSDGYTFISKRCQRFQSDIFATRLLFTKAVCIMGEEAAREFYHPDRFTRRGGALSTALRLLQDKESVAVMDGEAHRRRKQMFLSLMGRESIEQLVEIVDGEWRAKLPKWESLDEVVLFPEAQEILCRAISAWAGLPLTDAEGRKRTREFAAMIDGAGAFGPRNWWGTLLRARTERWAQEIVVKVRLGRLEVAEGSAVDVIARHRDLDAKLLDVKSAGVELLNVLRPAVAIARYVTFAALALHQFPECRPKLLPGDEEYLAMFVQEVRRFFPFFPMVGGRVLREFEWRDHHFAPGAWVLLDLYGTNHDARTWEEPEVFRPERFSRWDGSAFNFIPQGGGEFETNHRCPGEWITIELLKRAVRLLTTAMRYDVPQQDLRINLSRMPAIPKSRFVITNASAAG